MADVTRASAAKRVSSGDGTISLEEPTEAAEEDFFLPLSPSGPSGVTVDDVLSLLPPPLPLLPALAAALRLGLVLVGLDPADEAPPPASLPDPPDAPASVLLRGVTCRAGVDAAARRADAASSCCSCPVPDAVVVVVVAAAFVTVDVAVGGADAGGTP